MKKEKIWGALFHLSPDVWTGVWNVQPMSEVFDEAVWLDLVDRAADAGMNTIVVDVANAIRYDSHPEIAKEGAYSIDWMRKQVVLCREKGIALIPKLNFSAMHDEWLGDYGRMLCTGEYYRACGDLIRECIAIFDNPRFFHIGYDEEDIRNQSNHEHVILRQGELWWHDFLWFVKTVEAAGSRTWIWSDWIWEHHDEFLRRCPRSVLQSNWYYDQGFNERAFRWPRIKCYLDLDKAGFDQIATASNNVFASNAGETVEFCERNLSDGLLKGYLMSSWRRCLPSERDRNLEAVDLMAEACKKHIR